jgi:hypothetical protein
LTLEEELRQTAQLRLQAENVAMQELALQMQAELHEFERNAEKERAQLVSSADEVLSKRMLLQEEFAQMQILRLETESYVINEISIRMDLELKAVEAGNERIQLEISTKEMIAAQLNIANEILANEISIRMDLELKAVEADNERIQLEISTKEMIAAQLSIANEILAAEKLKNDREVVSLQIAKLRLATETDVAQAEAETLQAHSYANQLAHQRIEAAKNLQQYIDERVRDEQHYLALNLKRGDIELQERNAALARLDAEQGYFAEIEKRIAAENKAALVMNQRQIAEQLATQAAQRKWKMEKQTVLSLN